MEIKVEDHTKLAHKLAHKYKYAADRLNIDYDDLHQVALIRIWKAAQKFDNSKGFTFSTFASRVAINDMKALLRSATTGKYMISNPIGEQEGFMDHIPNRKSNDDFNEVELRLTIQQLAANRNFKGLKKRIIDCLLNDNCLNRDELSRVAGCTSSYVYVVMQDFGNRLMRA